jgi:hypothetical protein
MVTATVTVFPVFLEVRVSVNVLPKRFDTWPAAKASFGCAEAAEAPGAHWAALPSRSKPATMPAAKREAVRMET